MPSVLVPNQQKLEKEGLLSEWYVLVADKLTCATNSTEDVDDDDFDEDFDDDLDIEDDEDDD